MICPEGGYRAQPRVSTLGTLKINEFALTRHMNVRSMNNTRSSGLEMLKGREADLIKPASTLRQNLECAFETCYNRTYFRVVSTFNLPPLQHLQPGGPGVIHGTHIHVPCEGESLWAAVPRVETG
jgi:hypothetical protein